MLFARNIDTPSQLRAMTEGLRSASALTPVIAVDEEGGRVARIAHNAAFDVPQVGSMEEVRGSAHEGESFGQGRACNTVSLSLVGGPRMPHAAGSLVSGLQTPSRPW